MSFLKNLISGFVGNYGDDVARGAVNQYGDDVLGKLMASGGYSVADDLPLRHVSRLKISPDELSVNRPFSTNQIHEGTLFMSPKFSEIPEINGDVARKFFGNGRGVGVLDISNPETANLLADYYENAYRKLGGDINMDVVRNNADDLRRGMTETMVDRNGVLRDLFGDKIGLIRGRSALNEDEYVAVADDMLRKMGFKP